ncbi:hypothetical protein G6F46_009954 [Rhizopus delemar]|uniref:Uncharacterized protein n=3 Tax=Rhizopus TaxID=4842 RepID=I1CSM8_RHIO9|nr:hypothetical protein RO3G_16169 [Rhizopus delemar RA 99-880]KAG1046300.1 hypothetical protein G6F43_011140 [Rhizopus delemar]KAG1539923.1 hypothetical protein G6F51_008835 [Rhizopus arrhizus]KAG1454714.1 hypothetical protein G6F55_007461 [Rhizopus delemar]KAG1495407.1 hypothetical protein G6F54_007198 [Rhizopus delemar]|eukprot:EIE91458.1 hypothetical protein RO3G_16169 [Rhizopus delemar RA 99-880]
MSSSPIVITRFTGSTLEPSTEPIILYESHYYENKRPNQIKVIPTRCTLPLKRNNKPHPIIIPEYTFDEKYMDDNEFSAWSYEEDTATSSTDTLLIN